MRWLLKNYEVISLPFDLAPGGAGWEDEVGATLKPLFFPISFFYII
jgi:hypothetical protein